MNRKSGLLSLSDKVRAAGRGRDTVLAHITPEEAALLKERGGRGSTNPVTGLLEFEDEYSYSAPISMDYSAPSYNYSLPDLYTPPSNDYYSQNYGGYLPIDYGSNAILNNANQSSYATINDIYNNNINNLSNGLNNYSPTVNTPIDYSYLNPVAPPTTVTDYYDPGYNYGNVSPIQTPVTTPTQPDYTTTPVTPVEQPTYEQPQIQYNDPTASYRYDILGNLSPDAFYRSQFAPEFANEIYSNVNPNFSIDEQGAPDVATGDTTDGINTAPLAGDFVDAQGNLTREGLAPEVTPTVESNLADLPSENAMEASGTLSKPAARAFAAQQGLQTQATDLKSLADEAASAAGISPQKLYRIIAGESLHTNDYDININKKEESYGPLQLNRKGGLGTDFEAETGLSLKDPSTIPAQMRWAAEYIAQRGEDWNPKEKWFGYRGPDTTWDNNWGNAGFGPPQDRSPLPIPRPTDEQLAIYNPGSEYSAPLPPGRPTAEEFAAYSTPPALPPMITGVGNSAYNLPRGIMSYAEQPTPPANIPTQTGETPDANAVTSPSLIDRGIKAFPGAAIDLGLGALGLPFYGPLAFGMKLAGMETPGSMIGSNLTGGFANYPKSATATEYVPPVEAPAEIGKLPQTAGGTPIISYPAEGPVQVPPDVSSQLTTRSLRLDETPVETTPPTSTYDSAAPSGVPYASPFGAGAYALSGGPRSMSYSPPGSPSNEVLTGQAEEPAPTAQDVIAENYSPPLQEPGKEYTLPYELAFPQGEGAPAQSILDYGGFLDKYVGNPEQSYTLPGYAARIGQPQPYSPPYQPIDKQYALPEELANLGKPATPSPLDYANPSTKYVLPPSAGGVSPPGLTRNPTLEQQRIPAPGPMALPSSGGYSSSGGGTPNFGGGGGGGGPSVSVGGGGGGGSRAAAAPTGGGSLGTVSASNFGFQGIGGINRDYRSPIVESGRTVDFGTPSRQLAYDLNLPAIQQAAMNPNSYRSYLSQYKQLFG